MSMDSRESSLAPNLLEWTGRACGAAIEQYGLAWKP